MATALPHGHLPGIVFRVLAAGVLAAGCSGIRLDRPLQTREGDWPMFAGSPAHTNAIPQQLAPPLTEEWEYDVSGGIGNGSPLIVDSVVFIGNLRGELYALNERTGKRIGWIKLGEAIQGSPVISHTMAIVAVTNTRESLVSVDLRESRILWKRDYGEIEVSPIIINDRIYFGNTRGVFFCVERATGDVVWKFEIPDNKFMKGFHSSPACEGTTVLVGSDNGIVYAFQTDTGSLLWTFRAGGPVMASPSVASGLAYVGDLHGTMYGIDLATGQARWRHETDAPIFGSAAVAGDTLVFGTTGGKLLALRTTDGKRIWETDLGTPVNCAPMITGQYLYAGTLTKFLYGLKMADGSVAWKKEMEGRIKTAPAAADGRLFVATDERTVIAFRESDR